MSDALTRLAELHGVATEYVDARGERHAASEASLYAVLCALGAHVCYPSDVERELAAKERELAARRVPRVVIAWDCDLSIPLRFAAGERPAYQLTIRAEDGTESSFGGVADERWLVRAPTRAEGTAVYRVPVGSRLAPGCYAAAVEIDGVAHEVRAIAAPRRAWVPEDEHLPRKSWGVFAPVHALRSPSSLGVGDLHDLELLLSEIYRRGGRVVGTLPLLAAFLRDGVEPTPSMPVSRLFWNELYLDLPGLVEKEGSAEARAMLESPGVRESLHSLDSARYVESARVLSLKRPVLEKLADAFFEREGSQVELEKAFSASPMFDAYARFRATAEARGEAFGAWPERIRSGDLRPGDYDEASYRYHVYAQLRMREQLDALDRKARQGDGLGLCLDFPVGVHPDGFDVFYERGLFASGVSVGAPPDDYFRHGQDWGFPPLAPEAIRTGGYAYVRSCLANHMRHAGVLRLDHATWLDRVFFVSHGMEPKDGVYVHYPAEELHAVLAVESHRHRTLVVGEGLGAVPAEVRDGLAEHGMGRLHVVEAELEPLHASGRPLRELLPHEALASVSSHDLPTFASFVDCRDIDASLGAGHLDEHEARDARARRRAALEGLWRRAQPHEGAPLDAGVLLRHLLEELGASDARIVLPALEDLWLEEPKDAPGAVSDRPTSGRRLAHALPELFLRADVAAALGALDCARRPA